LGRGFRKFRLFHRFIIIGGILRRRLLAIFVTGLLTGLFAGLISGFITGYRLFLHVTVIATGEGIPKIR